jgi:tetratricopeptide (TPR) repeat protein
MRLAFNEANLARQNEEEQRKRQQENVERMEMFKQVLAIDSKDLLANYGLGSSLVELSRYQEAIPYLLEAISIQANHTVAYVALSSAYEALKDKDNAVRYLQKGIEVAAKRGDMEPLRKMKDKLAALDGGKSQS